MVKETSVISVIAVNDLMKMAQYIGSRTWDTVTPLVIAGIIYLLITILLTKLQGMLKVRVIVTKIFRKPSGTIWC